LPRESVLERCPDSAVEPSQLAAVEAGSRAERVEPRPPEGLVGIDVPHPRERALVEECSLERRAASREPFAETGGREESVERLVAYPLVEVGLCFSGLEQEPRAEAPDIAIGDARSVV
jgi:hypothetical protein